MGHGSTHLVLIFYVRIDSFVSSRNHEISVHNGLARHHLLKAAVKLLNAILQQLVEPVPVLSTHQAVLENPAALVVPQLQQLRLVLKTQVILL